MSMIVEYHHSKRDDIISTSSSDSYWAGLQVIHRILSGVLIVK